MAALIGLNVPQWRLESVARQPILMLRRFDRAENGSRVAFISAMTAIDGKDHGEQRSYLELADFLRQDGGAPEQDLHELWRRIVFYILISNTDDHLRNHAFLRSAKGWRLSPLYDANPCPAEVKHRIHALAINETDATGSLELALSVSDYFGIKLRDARELSAQVAAVVSKWRDIAKAVGLTRSDLDQMASAFEHEDLKAALQTAKGRKPAKGTPNKAAQKSPGQPKSAVKRSTPPVERSISREGLMSISLS